MKKALFFVISVLFLTLACSMTETGSSQKSPEELATLTSDMLTHSIETVEAKRTAVPEVTVIPTEEVPVDETPVLKIYIRTHAEKENGTPIWDNTYFPADWTNSMFLEEDAREQLSKHGGSIYIYLLAHDTKFVLAHLSEGSIKIDDDICTISLDEDCDHQRVYDEDIIIDIPAGSDTANMAFILVIWPLEE